MKNNITYYSHHVNSDEHPKFKMLRVKYGWEGEGKFWALNNRIADSENCELNLSKKYIKASIANDLNFTLEEFEEFLEYLEKDCDLIIKENSHITTEMVREILIKVMKERTRNKENYEKRVIQDVTKGKTQSKHVESKIQHVENIQRKGKETKGKETKVDTYVEKWNKFLEPKVTVLTKDRKVKLKVRLNEKSFLDNYDKILGIIKDTPFLCGENNKNWAADFDWIIANDTNYIKILEGKYRKPSYNKQSIKRHSEKYSNGEII